MKTYVLANIANYNIKAHEADKNNKTLGFEYECGNGKLINFIDQNENEQVIEKEEMEARELYETV